MFLRNVNYQYREDLVREVSLEMSLTHKVVESSFFDLDVKVHLVKTVLQMRKETRGCSLLPSSLFLSLCLLIMWGFPDLSHGIPVGHALSLISSFIFRYPACLACSKF